jgi:hypothetical protein
MPNRDPIFFNHGSNPRVPSPAAKALAFALKTKEATRAVKKQHDNLFYINRSIVDPTSYRAPRVNAGSFEFATWITTWSPDRGSR